MKNRYLEVTYNHGRPIAAYFYLPRTAGDKSHRTTTAEPGMIIDYTEAGKPIGIEITAPAKVTVNDLLPSHLNFASTGCCPRNA